jgi:hypothetical protein
VLETDNEVVGIAHDDHVEVDIALVTRMNNFTGGLVVHQEQLLWIVSEHSPVSVSLFVPEAPGRASGQWWPAELGFPNGSGGQNQVRYAYFNPTRRLAVELNEHVTVYDSLDHEIGGVSQQQGGGGSLTFTSQYGTVSVSSLPIASVEGAPSSAPEPRRPPASPPNLETERAQTPQEIDIFAKIERLADLQQKGIVSPEEFTPKKAELLSRL